MYEGVGLGKQSKSSTSTVESYRQCLKFSKLRSNSTRMILNKLEQKYQKNSAKRAESYYSYRMIYGKWGSRTLLFFFVVVVTRLR